MRSFVFDVDTDKQPSQLAASGCFSVIHQGHLDFVSDFKYVGQLFKSLPICIYLNTKDYIQKNKFDIENLDYQLRQRESFFKSQNIPYKISDDPITEFGLKDLYWFVGSEYLNKWFKESRQNNPNVIGNIYRQVNHIASSTLLSETKTLWNIKNILNNQ